jgi:hypothetical protein
MQDQSDANANAIAVVAEEGPDAGYWVIVRAVAQPETIPPSSALWKVGRSLDRADLTWEVAYMGDGPVKSPATNIVLIPGLLKVAGKAVHHAAVWVAHHAPIEDLWDILSDASIKIFKAETKAKKSDREQRELRKAMECAREFIAPLWDIDPGSGGLLCTEIRNEDDMFYFMLRYGNLCAAMKVKKEGDTYSVQSCENGELKKTPKEG